MRKVTLSLVAIAIALFAACASDEQTEQAQPTTPPAAGDTTMSTGSCVEQYSIETLKKRDYAFDGTIKSMEADAADGPDTVVFTVQKWFKGGSGAEATRKAYGFGSGLTSAGGTAHKVGDRLLVAGDEDFVWECGFTQDYDADVAAEWDAALE